MKLSNFNEGYESETIKDLDLILQALGCRADIKTIIENLEDFNPLYLVNK